MGSSHPPGRGGVLKGAGSKLWAKEKLHFHPRYLLGPQAFNRETLQGLKQASDSAHTHGSQRARQDLLQLARCPKAWVLTTQPPHRWQTFLFATFPRESTLVASGPPEAIPVGGPYQATPGV